MDVFACDGTNCLSTLIFEMHPVCVGGQVVGCTLYKCVSVGRKRIADFEHTTDR